MTLNQSLYKKKLKEHGLTQKVLAEAFGENEKTFSAYIKTGNYDDDTLSKIASKLGTSVNELWQQSSTEDVSFTIEYYTKYIKLLEKREQEREINLLHQKEDQVTIEAYVQTIFQFQAILRAKVENREIGDVEDEMHKALALNAQRIAEEGKKRP